MAERARVPDAWAKQKRASFRFRDAASGDHASAIATGPGMAQFENPFAVADLGVFDDLTLRDMLESSGMRISAADLATALHTAAPSLVNRISEALPVARRERFLLARRYTMATADRAAATERVLDAFFWELTYWLTPGLYRDLIAGERLHPGIFRLLAPRIVGKEVLDAGAGTGRAAMQCLRTGAAHLYAVEPSVGLLRMLESAAEAPDAAGRLLTAGGRFKHLPLDDNSVDTSVVCSAFTSDDAQCGERGLAELIRVTRPGGTVVIIWPQPADLGWLAERGFRYAALPMSREMTVRFRSMATAERCVRRFHARNDRATRWLRRTQRPELPFSVLGFAPPHDLCWLGV